LTHNYKKNKDKQIQNRFDEPGTYQINAEIETENQETIQENIEIEIQESESGEIEAEQEPELTLNKPSETQTYSDGSIEFEFEVENGVQGSEYQIIIDESSEIARMLPEEGENQITEEITLSTGEYETYIQLNQNGETYKSETITLDVEEQIEQPEFTLDSPNDGETIETFDEETDVEFEFTVEDRAWAEEAKIKIEQTQNQNTRLISSDQKYIEDFNLESSEEGISYDWIVTLKHEDSQVSSEKSFNLIKESPQFSIFEQSEEVRENGYEVDFYLEFEADSTSEITAYYIDDQGQEEMMSSEYIDEDSSEFEFSHFFDSEGEYSWYILVEDLESGEVIKESDTSSFEITEEDDGDTIGGGDS